ncbi:MAG TPA: hypothetical protein VMA95_03485 [Streptosporangiaceae bacterium]|nr:hypothetical protein [Streptosporangiaceae bacterium]
MPDPDDFDQQLRDLTSGQAEPARFTELSAAERARRSQSPPPPATKQKRRSAKKARQLRKPIGDTGAKRAPRGKRKLRAVGSTARKPRPAGSRRQRLLYAARVVGILVAFAALLYGLHLLGFGPQ